MGYADKVISVAEDPGNFSLYIYGPPGVGKTVFALDGSDRPLLLDVERGRRSLLNHPNLVNIPVLSTPTFKDVEDVLWAVIDGDKFFDDKKTLVIDTVSELQSRELREQVRMAHKANPNRHPDLPSQAEYNINNIRLKKLVLAFRENTDKNLILLSHVKEERDDEGNTVLIRPNTSPTLTAQLVGLMDGVFYMTADSKRDGATTRKLRVIPTRQNMAKNRFGFQSPELENPHFSMIVKADETQRATAAKLKKEESPVQMETDGDAKKETSVLNL